MGIFDSVGNFLFGKPKRSDIQAPEYRNTSGASSLTDPLRDVAQRSAKFALRPRQDATAAGFGLGSDLTSRVFSPIAKQSDLKFRRQTAPRISSEMSGRGLGRSTQAVSSIRRADETRNSDLDALLGNLEVLNRQAAGQEIQQGLQMGQNLQGRDIAQTNLASRANLEVLPYQLQQNQHLNQLNQQRSNQMMQMAGALAGGIGGMAGGAGTGSALASFGLKPLTGGLSSGIPVGLAENASSFGGRPAALSNILGMKSSDLKQALLDEFSI